MCKMTTGKKSYEAGKKKYLILKDHGEKRKRPREQNIRGVPTHNEKNAPVDNHDIYK